MYPKSGYNPRRWLSAFCLAVLALAFALVFAACQTRNGSRPDLFADAVEELCDEIAAELEVGSEAIAVLDFENSLDATATRDFGRYFTDTFLTVFKQQNPEFGFIERSMIDRILTEQAMNFGGELDAEKIQNISALLPARYIISANYTVFSQTIECNFRVIDVRGGSIVTTRNAVFAIDDNIAMLLARGQGGSMVPQAAAATAAPATGPTLVWPSPEEFSALSASRRLQFLDQAYRELDQAKEAEDWYMVLELAERYVRYDTANAEVFFLWGIAYNQLDHPREAIPQLENAVALKPDVSSYHHILADAYWMSRIYEPAKTNYQQAIALAPHSGWSYHHLGELLIQMGDKSGARTILEQGVLKSDDQTATKACKELLDSISTP